MKIFATFNEQGLPTGFYNTEIHNIIPELAIEISKEDWETFVTYPNKYRLNNNKIEEIPIPEPTISELKNFKLKEISNLRYKIETGGILVNGISIKTDRESQFQITSIYLAMKNGLITSTIDFKNSTGWANLNFEDLETIANQVCAHVQKCFSNEKVLSEKVLSLKSKSAVENFDINVGW